MKGLPPGPPGTAGAAGAAAAGEAGAAGVLALSGRWAPAMAHLRGKAAAEVRRAARSGWLVDPMKPVIEYKGAIL